MPICSYKQSDYNLVGLKSVRKIDPTRTTGLRNRFRTDMEARFKRIRKNIIISIVEKDCFALRKEKIYTLQVNAPTSRKQFDFPRSQEKVNQFLSWLDEQQRNELFTLSTRMGRSVVGDVSWMDTYIESSYKQGILHAQSAMVASGAEFVERQINAAFYQPIHTDRVGLLYTRCFTDLKGITDEMDKQISRILADGLVQGTNPRELAREMVNRVDKIGIVRARTLTRTEIIRAHAEATLNEFEEARLDEVELEAEWLTAGYNVCPECEALEGQVFTIEEAHGMLPLHPNCRCTWLPVIKNRKKR